MKVTPLSIFLCFLLIHSTKGDLCQYNFNIFDLPSGAVAEVLGFITGGISMVLLGCSETINNDDVKFWLYTRDAPDGIILDSQQPQISNKKTVVLIPGWLCNVTNDLMPELKNAYLKRYDANVIIVDWSKYSGELYTKSYCYAQKVAEYVASFLCKLENQFSINVSDIHVLGHSMGGQISGMVGGNVKSICNKTVGRITGLDPAGPYYVGVSESKRLDKSDATFVDVIHTNSLILGYHDRCGHVDFYPNGGTTQAGCRFSLVNPFQKDGCSHLRSVDYMAESVNSDNFLACNSDNNKAIMGEGALGAPEGSYYLKTNEQSPFGTGTYNC
ncbi:hypothetical protein FQA39_LY08532 [Lamprigera yunnana]|nr:hypothetical protein FQA39_LY08532 [Lamprigera yunnana]